MKLFQGQLSHLLFEVAFSGSLLGAAGLRSLKHSFAWGMGERGAMGTQVTSQGDSREAGQAQLTGPLL